MDSALLAAQLLLAAVFGVAGVGKLRDLDGSRSAMEEFGVPARLAAPAGVALPVAELVVVVALLFPPSARWGAAGAIALLLAFIGGIANALRHGRAPDCHCFGQIHSEPAGKSTLARNGVLAAIAASVLAFGPAPSISGWVAERSGGELILSGVAVAAVLAFAAWLRARWRQRGLELKRREASLPPGIPIGNPAPDFALSYLGGEPETLSSLRSLGRPVALFFTHPQCGPCHELLPALARWRTSFADELTIVIVTEGGAEANREVYDPRGLANVLLQEVREVYQAYAMRGTPSAVVVSPDGRIASATAEGALPIEELVRLTLRRAAPAGSRLEAPAGA